MEKQQGSHPVYRLLQCSHRVFHRKSACWDDMVLTPDLMLGSRHYAIDSNVNFGADFAWNCTSYQFCDLQVNGILYTA